MNSATRILLRGVVVLAMVTLLFLCGCAGYPLNMTAQEWNSLTPEQRTEAGERQKMIDRHDADTLRCRREAARKAVIGFPSGGLNFNPLGSGSHGKMEISLGQDAEYYHWCMDRAGWKVPLIISRTPIDDVTE